MVKVFLSYSDMNKVSRLLHLRVTPTGLIHIICFVDFDSKDYEFVEVKGGVEINAPNTYLQLWLQTTLNIKKGLL